MGKLNKAQINKALDGVIDPHMKVSINAVGMVRGIEVAEGGAVEVALSFPCIGCPARELIHADIRDRVGKLSGVSRVKIRDEWLNKWNPADISEEARAKAKASGYLL